MISPPPCRTTLVFLGAFLSTTLMGACSSSSPTEQARAPEAPKPCASDAECSGSKPGTVCDIPKKSCESAPIAGEIGHGDGSPSSVTFTEVYSGVASSKLVDLAFDSSSGNLWAIGSADDSVHVGTDTKSEKPVWTRYHDPAARHFMNKPSGIAMSGDGFFGTCGNNDNSQNGPANLFMGPAMFSTDLAVFAKATEGGLGSHFDMLHGSPMCRGIAHEKGHIFWVFNSYDKSIDRYDFGKPHEAGGDDHSDGKIYRYASGQVKGADDGTTPSHLVFDEEEAMLYIADTGNARILRLNPANATKGSKLERRNEPLVEDAVMTGAEIEIVVDGTGGLLSKPSGIEMKGGLLYVTDAATSTFHVFDKSGAQLRTLDTGLAAGALSGFVFGPDGKIWFTDRVGGRVLRIDPSSP